MPKADRLGGVRDTRYRRLPGQNSEEKFRSEFSRLAEGPITKDMDKIGHLKEGIRLNMNRERAISTKESMNLNGKEASTGIVN